MRIGLDIDNCMYPFVERFRELCLADGIGTPYWFSDESKYEFFEAWGMGRQVFDDLCNEFVDAGELYWWGTPLEGCVEVLTRLHDDGHELHVVTRRQFGSHPEDATRSWLLNHNIPHDSLTFSADKTCVPTDIFIEDNLDNYDALEAAGTCAVLMNHDWNQDTPGVNARRRVYSWGGFYEFVTQYASWYRSEEYWQAVVGDPDVDLVRLPDDIEAVSGVHDISKGFITSSMIASAPLPTMRQFDTGATRNEAEHKHDYEGFLSPLVLRRFGAYMHSHQEQADGQLRPSDNWQKGMPLDAYMKSAWRHFMDWWELHRSTDDTIPDFDGEPVEIDDAICGLLFNLQGYLHEHLKIKHGQERHEAWRGGG